MLPSLFKTCKHTSHDWKESRAHYANPASVRSHITAQPTGPGLLKITLLVAVVEHRTTMFIVTDSH